MIEKLKSFLANDTYFTVLIILAVGVGSFGLGRLSVLQEQKHVTSAHESIALQQLQSASVVEIEQTASGIPVVASKSGTKYHLLDCPGAKQMKEGNKIFFASIELAKAAGYTAAGNCKGLQ